MLVDNINSSCSCNIYFITSVTLVDVIILATCIKHHKKHENMKFIKHKTSEHGFGFCQVGNWKPSEHGFSVRSNFKVWFCVISSSLCHELSHVNKSNFVQYFIGICKITRA